MGCTLTQPKLGGRYSHSQFIDNSRLASGLLVLESASLAAIAAACAAAERRDGRYKKGDWREGDQEGIQKRSREEVGKEIVASYNRINVLINLH